ncbi:MAG: hypothetical protein S4CHLAM6_04510 [Chlamydiae bacterium]|nr:hypothetical protein [Chlamydiota bacterium]
MKAYPKNTVLLLIFLLIMSSCSPTTSNDYQTQACVIMKKFVKDLKKINDPKQLKKKQKLLKKHFNNLTNLMIDYRIFLDKQPEIDQEESVKMQQRAYELKCELYRIYQLDGGLDLIEEVQKDAYLKLSLFEHSLTNKRIDLFKHSKPLTKE